MREQERSFYNALCFKHKKSAILKEVTVPDEEAEHVYRTWLATYGSPWYKRTYDQQGLTYDAVIPDGYDHRNVKLTRRIDFLMFEGQEITAVEMKVSKADFRRDTEDKRRAWKNITNRFVYLTPEGMLNPDEVPEGCGLWEFHNGRIVVVKKAKRNPEPQPFPPSMIKYFAWRVFTAETRRRR